jgi:hypothetical protein
MSDGKIMFTCAVRMQGCPEIAVLDPPPGYVVPEFATFPAMYQKGYQEKLAAYVLNELDERVEWQLLMLGWRRVDGHWLCGNHPEDLRWHST